MRYRAYTSADGSTTVVETTEGDKGVTFPTVDEALEYHEKELEEAVDHFRARLSALRRFRKERPLPGQGSLFAEEPPL